MQFELNHLRHFYEVGRRGGFTRAATALRVQQPTVSRSVRLLEEALGVTLLERHARRIILTPVGERIFASCRRLFEEVENVGRIADDERSECTGQLKIAAAGAVASHLLPASLPEFRRRHARVWPMVFCAPASMVFNRLKSGELELGIYFYTPTPPDGLEVKELVQMRFRVVIAAKHARSRAVRQSFIGSREVEDDAATQFPTLERLRRIEPDATIQISTNDATAHLRLVEAGMGVSILPAFMVDEGIAKGRLADVFPQEHFEFPLLLVSRKRQHLSRAARLLLEAISERAASSQTRATR